MPSVNPSASISPVVRDIFGDPDTEVRDALYDLVPLNRRETALMSTPEFLRLDRIQQLGFVSRVWPGAKHTRYEHSIGVMHLTRLAIAHLAEQPVGAWISVRDARTAIAAALLHDIGHYPFSHAIEELGPPVRTHEEVGRGLIERGEIALVLERDWDVDPARVAALIHAGRDELPEADRVLRGLLSGTLDMDKLDYLPRDAHACSVPYGGVDARRLLGALTFADVPETLQASLPVPSPMGTPPARRGRGKGGPTSTRTRVAVTEKGISPLHSLINARQEMFDNVYWHHTNRACMIMLLRAVQEALVAGAITSTNLTAHDDATLMAFMRAPEMPDATRRLADALADRRMHKRAVEVSARAFELYARLGNLWFDPVARRSVELDLCRGLATMLGEAVPDTAILIDIPKPEKWKTDVWVQFQRPPVGYHPMMTWQEVVGLADDDFKRYEEHRRLIRIVTEERYREVVADRWEQLIYPLLGGAF
ncbi:MAG: HD domain-containing protein [Thermomicrobiales bacterium]